MIHYKIDRTRMSWIALVIVTIGCDDQVATVSREAANRQAEQNRVMARLQQEVAHGSRSLVEADASARREIIRVHRDLQSERKQLDGSWNALESERRGIAKERRNESLLAPVAQILGGAVLLAALLAFLRQLLQGTVTSVCFDPQLNELLVDELLSQQVAGSARQHQLPPTSRERLPLPNKEPKVQ